MMSVKSVIVLSCALLGVAFAETQAEEMAKRNCRPFVDHRNQNVRRCHDLPAPCPPVNRNVRPNPACPRPCDERPCHRRRHCTSSSSSSSFCSDSSSSSSSDCGCPKPKPVCHKPKPVCSSSSSSSSVCESSSSSTECHPHHPQCGPVQLDVNGGWYKFHFGQCGSQVCKTWDFVTVGPSVLRVTDLACSGDALSVYDHGQLILQTPLIGGDNCHHGHELVSPHHAYDSEHYSHGRVNLQPGAHKITIVVARSPKGRGVGALRVDSVMSHCPRELNGLKVVNTPVPHHKAAGVCRAMGMKLADLDIYNFLDATTLAWECAGPFSASWVHSYFKDTYNHKCLALYTGNSAPGGSVNVPASCDELLPVICQEITCEESSCDCHHDHHHEHNHHHHHDCSYANHEHVCGECSSWSDN